MQIEQQNLIKQLKERYISLPWYTKFWFHLWSWKQARCWSTLDPRTTTVKYLERLIYLSESAWFFKSAFGLINLLKEGMAKKTIFTRNPYVLDYINSFLSNNDRRFFTDTCKWTREQLKQQKLGDLLRLLVAKGKQKTVAEIVQNYPNLLLKKGSVIDYSMRIFKEITPFTYALWALDTQMWKAMVHNLPSGNESENVRKALFVEYENLEQRGVEYKVNDQIIKEEQHFNLDRLIGVLRTYTDNYYHWTIEQRKHHWCKEVGDAQYFVPAHVAHEYCNEAKSFNPVPTFKEALLSRTLQFYNASTKQTETWWNQKKMNYLGLDFAISTNPGRDGRRKEARGVLWAEERHVAADLQAISTLFEIRTTEFKMFKRWFGRTLQFAEHYQSVQESSRNEQIQKSVIA